MKLEERPVSQTEGAILAHNIAFPSGKKALSKGTLITAKEIARLSELGLKTVMVAVLAPDDVLESTAASRIAQALKADHLRLTEAVGGRINFQAEVDGLLQVDPARLLAFNSLPGITLATRPHHLVVGPNQTTDQIATLKIIPYAVPQSDVKQALNLAPGIMALRPIPPNQKAALLLTGAEAVHAKLKNDFVPPTETRLKKLGATLTTVESVTDTPAAIATISAQLAQTHNLLIIAGQTSIMDIDDITPRALKMAGAEVTLHGAPVEPGNLLALAYFANTPVMCAPGCARNLNYNVVDLALPRLLLGDKLTRADVAGWGLGGLLEKIHF